MKLKNIFILLIVIFLAVSTVLTQNESTEHINAKLLRVVDGDTIKVSIQGKTETVRLIGIDTPECKHPDESLNTLEGILAKEYTEKILAKEKFTLEIGRGRRDKYERLLAYVHIKGKDETLQEMLLKSGHAEIMTIPPNTKYLERFKNAKKEASK